MVTNHTKYITNLFLINHAHKSQNLVSAMISFLVQEST